MILKNEMGGWCGGTATLSQFKSTCNVLAMITYNLCRACPPSDPTPKPLLVITVSAF